MKWLVHDQADRMKFGGWRNGKLTNHHPVR